MRHVRMGVHCATHSGPCMYDYTYTDRTTHIHIGLYIYIYDHPPPHFDCPQSNGTQQRKTGRKKKLYWERCIYTDSMESWKQRDTSTESQKCVSTRNIETCKQRVYNMYGLNTYIEGVYLHTCSYVRTYTHIRAAYKIYAYIYTCPWRYIYPYTCQPKIWHIMCVTFAYLQT